MGKLRTCEAEVGFIVLHRIRPEKSTFLQTISWQVRATYGEALMWRPQFTSFYPLPIRVSICSCFWFCQFIWICPHHFEHAKDFVFLPKPLVGTAALARSEDRRTPVRAMICLSRGGQDAFVAWEFDLERKAFVKETEGPEGWYVQTFSKIPRKKSFWTHFCIPSVLFYNLEGGFVVPEGKSVIASVSSQRISWLVYTTPRWCRFIPETCFWWAQTLGLALLHMQASFFLSC